MKESNLTHVLSIKNADTESKSQFHPLAGTNNWKNAKEHKSQQISYLRTRQQDVVNLLDGPKCFPPKAAFRHFPYPIKTNGPDQQTTGLHPLVHVQDKAPNWQMLGFCYHLWHIKTMVYYLTIVLNDENYLLDMPEHRTSKVTMSNTDRSLYQVTRMWEWETSCQMWALSNFIWPAERECLNFSFSYTVRTECFNISTWEMNCLN